MKHVVTISKNKPQIAVSHDWTSILTSLLGPFLGISFLSRLFKKGQSTTP